MNKRECERDIFNKMQEIVQILKKYNPDAAMLSLTFIEEYEVDRKTLPGFIAFNTHCDKGEKKAINFSAFNNPPWLEKGGWCLNFTEPKVNEDME